MTESYLFIGFILIAAVLTYFALKVSMILFRLAAAMSWLGLGIWLLLSDTTHLQMGDVWTQVFGTIFIVMTIAVLTLQMRTDIKHEAQVRGKVGFPGAETESWTTWGPKGKKKAPTAKERQDAHRAEVRSRLGRK